MANFCAVFCHLRMKPRPAVAVAAAATPPARAWPRRGLGLPDFSSLGQSEQRSFRAVAAWWMRRDARVCPNRPLLQVGRGVVCLCSQTLRRRGRRLEAARMDGLLNICCGFWCCGGKGARANDLRCNLQSRLFEFNQRSKRRQKQQKTQKVTRHSHQQRLESRFTFKFSLTLSLSSKIDRSRATKHRARAASAAAP